uniref:Glycosyl transferase n=1 Tax=Hydatigena taeniaeformis TaxID=6205 RepID=A0A0R3WL51_HYDTA
LMSFKGSLDVAPLDVIEWNARCQHADALGTTGEVRPAGPEYRGEASK